MSEEKSTASQQELLVSLEKQLEYHENGGTDYRQETVRMAIEVASQFEDTTIFFDRQNTLKIVQGIFRGSDHDRLLDLSKMLSISTYDIHDRKTLPEDIKQKVEERMKKVKKIELVR